MFDNVSKTLRAGIIAGLSILVMGIIVETIYPSLDAVKELGLWLIVSTPPAGLTMMLLDFVKRKEPSGVALSLVMLATIIASALLMISR